MFTNHDELEFSVDITMVLNRSKECDNQQPFTNCLGRPQVEKMINSVKKINSLEMMHNGRKTRDFKFGEPKRYL